ncbi:hypothetical protein [Mesorhizobium sp. M0037]|uniref:hypothetical protein n=1 Tax=unclassified Mesorhizobium TaxID=325217 RepID=UPI00333A416B
MSDLASIIVRLTAIAQDVDRALADVRGLQGEDVPLPAPPQPAAPIIVEPERRVDLIGIEWVDIGVAATRFQRSKDSIWRWCDRDRTFGWKYGGRWLVSITKVRAKLNIG